MSFWIYAIIWAVFIAIIMWGTKPKLHTVVFIVTIFIGLETYLYFRHKFLYLPIGFQLLFYAVPVCVFLISSFAYCKITNTEWEEARSQDRYWEISVIITIWLLLPTVFILLLVR